MVDFDSVALPDISSSCCCPFSKEAMVVIFKLPIFASAFNPKRPLLEPPNITYFVEGSDKEILPAWID